jgi:hypothetical protein
MTEQTIPIVLIGKTTEVGTTVTDALKPEYEGVFHTKKANRQQCPKILTSPSHPLPRLCRSSHQRTTPTLDWQEAREPIIWEFGHARLH